MDEKRNGFGYESCTNNWMIMNIFSIIFECHRLCLKSYYHLYPQLKQSTAMRDPISPSERLAVTLRYLVTGDPQCTGHH